MTEVRKVYTNIAPSGNAGNGRPSTLRALLRLFYLAGCLIRAALSGGPGVSFHAAVAARALLSVRHGLAWRQAYAMVSAPLDTFRYFEFDFFWRCIAGRRSLGRFLDLSSPRLFTWRVLASGRARGAVIANPDSADLSTTRELYLRTGLANACELRLARVDELREPPGSFDTVVCISVLEHIPAPDDIAALSTMWSLVRPQGGRLLLSVPCAREGFEEHVDWDEYGLLRPDVRGFVFGQRFYDRSMLTELIYSVVGCPARIEVFGENEAGRFFSNRQRRLREPGYPYWREPLMMANEYRRFDDVGDLPGVGVVAFEFVKP
jgi:SAM-dependent methyltransferase